MTIFLFDLMTYSVRITVAYFLRKLSSFQINDPNVSVKKSFTKIVCCFPFPKLFDSLEGKEGGQCYIKLYKE